MNKPSALAVLIFLVAARGYCEEGDAAAHLERYIGIRSCAAANCHGGWLPDESTEDQRLWRSALSVWAALDPHAQAYRVLQSDRSRQIVSRLDPGVDVDGAAEYERYLANNCTVCHATPDPAHQPPVYGVACESCHGPAAGWVDLHRRADYAPTGDAARTSDLVARARICARCHVGSAEGDVGHDLIAAGHPRLAFEFAAYLANLPRHWPSETGQQFHARAWLVGQAATLEASLELLEARAAGATGGVWPEFSEYNCFGCHHGLKQPSFRQQAGSSGSFDWGSWPWGLGRLFSKLPREPADNRTSAAADLAGLAPELEQLAVEMNRPDPSAPQVRRLLSSLRPRLLQILQDSQNRSNRPGAELVDLFRAPLEPADWDRAVQWKLALDALHDARLESQQSALDSQIQDARQRLTEVLSYPESHDSPRDYEPQEFLEQVHSLEQLVRQLGL